MKLKFFM